MPNLLLDPRPVVTHRRDLTLPTGFIPPCLPMTAPHPPSGPLWLHEIKHDGLRVIARKDGEWVRLYGPRGEDLTRRLPLIWDAVARLPSSCTIDGEVVVWDHSPAPSAKPLQHPHLDAEVCLRVFDLLELAGEDRRRDPLEQRKIDQIGRAHV